MEEKLDKAVLTGEAQQIICDNCFENLLFHLRDTVHDFSISLSDILLCLEFAEKEGFIPKISAEWWTEVKCHYQIK